jgi:hypothetical protein
MTRNQRSMMDRDTATYREPQVTDPAWASLEADEAALRAAFPGGDRDDHDAERFRDGAPPGTCGYYWVTRGFTGAGTAHWCGRAGSIRDESHVEVTDGGWYSQAHRCACGEPC